MIRKLTLSLCALLGLFACNREGDKETTLTSADTARTAEREKPTAMPQTDQPASDRRIVRDFEQSLSSDESLSLGAKNVRIVVMDSTVTLHGTVKSQRERDAVADKAKRIPGVSRVDNLIEIEKSDTSDKDKDKDRDKDIDRNKLDRPSTRPASPISPTPSPMLRDGGR